MKRRVFVKNLGVASAGIALAPWSDVIAEAETSEHLVILHTNDMHSRIEPFPNDGRKHGGMGGMAARASLVKKIRKEGKHVLLLDSGDIFQGTPYFNYFRGELEFKLMTQMGYDASTLGNHDFDNGLEGLLKQMPNAGFPFVVSNYTFDEMVPKNLIKDHIIFQKGKIRVGIFGLGIELKGLVGESLYGNTMYHDPVSVAQQKVALLRKEGCHVVIALSHLGFKYGSDKISDVLLASQVSGIDLILGGHTHTFMEKPYIQSGPEGWETSIHQAGWAGIVLGRIDFIFSRSLRKKAVFSTSVQVSNKSSVG